MSSKLGNGKHKAVRSLSGDKFEALKGKDAESSLDLDKRAHQNKLPDGVFDKFGNFSVEVGVAVKNIVEAIDSIVDHNESDGHFSEVTERMGADCGDNVIISS